MVLGECLMYGLDFEARCLASVSGDESGVRFLVGTQNIKMDNQICELTVDLDENRVNARCFGHSIGEVRELATSPDDPQIFATASSDFRHPKAKHRLNIYSYSEYKPTLEEKASLECDHPIIGLEWSVASSSLSCIAGNQLTLYNVADDGLKEQFSHHQPGKLHTFRRSPHSDGQLIALAVDRDLIVVDSRTNEPTTRICEAHVFRCLAVDFNPNLPNLLATGGDEGALRIWDLRQPKAAIFCTRPHSHWVTQVRYHQVHDQLLLTGSSDACVVLNCAQSVSSDAQIDASAERDDDGEPLAKLTDGELDRINEHEDTVSAVEWSSADPWIYASLSYDGRVVINRVARQHKYALMQL